MSLTHNIRNFAETKLQGVIPWSKFLIGDDATSDNVKVSIQTEKGSYRIHVQSSYAMPPLGQVVFKDNEQGHEIEGQNQDVTWHRISEYLKARESGEAVPAAIEAAAAPTPPITRIPLQDIIIPPAAMVYYISDPGVWYQNGPAFVTRVHPDGSYNLTVMPDGSEPFYRQNIRQRSDSLQNVCWVPYQKTFEEPKMVTLDTETGQLVPVESPRQSAEINELRATVDSLIETVSRLKASAFDQRKVA